MRDIKGYEDLYAVSEDGQVWSYRTERFLKHNQTQGGYEMVSLYDKDGVFTPSYIHRLVAETYIDNPNGFNEINHIDENIHNNHYSNLEWCGHSYNINYGTRNKRASETRLAKAKTVIGIPVREGIIKQFFNANDASKRIALEQGKTASNVYIGIKKCLYGDNKTAYGYYWKEIDGKQAA